MDTYYRLPNTKPEEVIGPKKTHLKHQTSGCTFRNKCSLGAKEKENNQDDYLKTSEKYARQIGPNILSQTWWWIPWCGGNPYKLILNKQEWINYIYICLSKFHKHIAAKMLDVYIFRLDCLKKILFNWRVELVGGWTNPSDKYAQVNLGKSSPNFRGEH